MKLIWDESKRLENIGKHGLDFANATIVLNSRYRMDVLTVRGVETRMQSFSYVVDRLAVLTVVHIDRDKATRIISFRSASKNESEVYYDWINQEDE